MNSQLANVLCIFNGQVNLHLHCVFNVGENKKRVTICVNPRKAWEVNKRMGNEAQQYFFYYFCKELVKVQRPNDGVPNL